MVRGGDSFVWQGDTPDIPGRREQLGNVLGCAPAHCLFAFQLPTQKRHLVFEAYCRYGTVVCPSWQERSPYRPVRIGRIWRCATSRGRAAPEAGTSKHFAGDRLLNKLRLRTCMKRVPPLEPPTLCTRSIRTQRYSFSSFCVSRPPSIWWFGPGTPCAISGFTPCESSKHQRTQASGLRFRALLNERIPEAEVALA